MGKGKKKGMDALTKKLSNAYLDFDFDKIGEINTKARNAGVDDMSIRKFNADAAVAVKDELVAKMRTVSEELADGMIELLHDIDNNRLVIP